MLFCFFNCFATKPEVKLLILVLVRSLTRSWTSTVQSALTTPPSYESPLSCNSSALPCKTITLSLFCVLHKYFFLMVNKIHLGHAIELGISNYLCKLGIIWIFRQSWVVFFFYYYIWFWDKHCRSPLVLNYNIISCLPFPVWKNAPAPQDKLFPGLLMITRRLLIFAFFPPFPRSNFLWSHHNIFNLWLHIILSSESQSVLRSNFLKKKKKKKNCNIQIAYLFLIER
jgi:hypothetical protein